MPVREVEEKEGHARLERRDALRREEELDRARVAGPGRGRARGRGRLVLRLLLLRLLRRRN